MLELVMEVMLEAVEGWLFRGFEISVAAIFSKTHFRDAFATPPTSQRDLLPPDL